MAAKITAEPPMPAPRRVPTLGAMPLVRELVGRDPELGAPSRDDTGGATMLEALRRAFQAVARHGPAVALLDDLHWADDTTLVEVLPDLAVALEEEPLLLVGVYRSDEIARGHSLRR